MLKKYSLLLVLSLSLFGCGSEANEKNSSGNKQAVSTKASETTMSKISGSYKKNDTTILMNDFVVVWLEDHNKLKIIQTPTTLTEDERKKIKEGKSVFFALATKESPNKETWDWYPYVVTELSFKSKEINSDNLKNIYILAYGIEEANSTDNLNILPNDNNSFKIIEYANDKLIIEYSGNYEIIKDKHSWSIQIK